MRKGRLAHKVFKDQRVRAGFKGLRASTASTGPIQLFLVQKVIQDTPGLPEQIVQPQDPLDGLGTLGLSPRRLVPLAGQGPLEAQGRPEPQGRLVRLAERVRQVLQGPRALQGPRVLQGPRERQEPQAPLATWAKMA